jgi:hypothetical protein
MKTITAFSLFLLFWVASSAQVTTNKTDGGTVITKLGMGIKVNDGSSLTRQWIILNDEKCPLKLNNTVGINTVYNGNGYEFVASGGITVVEPIVAYEIDFVLYDIFGEHIQTLSCTEINDISQPVELGKHSSWYATENQISEYFFCVSYVAKVRTKSGVIWRYDPLQIKQELNKIQIAYDESYSPSIDKNKK